MTDRQTDGRAGGQAGGLHQQQTEGQTGSHPVQALNYSAN